MTAASPESGIDLAIDRAGGGDEMRLSKRLCMAAILALAASDAGAQFRQYTPPGGSFEPVEDDQTRLEDAVADARWHLGPVRLAPWFGVRQVAYVDDALAGQGTGQQKVSDLTATVGAGLTAYLRTGSKVTWMAQALPEYVWWRDLTERRQVIGRYGAGLFGFFNHLQVEVTGGRDETQAQASSEIPQQIIHRRDRGQADLELRLGGKTGLFAGASVAEIEDRSQRGSGADDGFFSALDRRETVYRFGVRYRPSDRSVVGLGVEHSETSSSSSARDLSNSGTSPTLELGLEGTSMRLELHLVDRELDPESGSEFATYHRLGGDLLAVWTPGSGRLRLQLYAHSLPTLSLFDEFSVFDERRTGVAAAFKVNRRVDFQAYAETGENRYLATAGLPSRTDDYRGYGARISFAVARSVTFDLHADVGDYTSDVSTLNRDVTTVGFGLTLASDRLLWE